MSRTKVKHLPTKFYFIHYADSEFLDPEAEEDCVSLNGVGGLYIGYGDVDEKNYEELLGVENTFFAIEDARFALRLIRQALSNSTSRLTVNV